MNIKNYISKESIFVAGVTAVLATIVTSIIDNKEIKKAEQNVEEARKTIGEAKEAAERLQKTMTEIEAETVKLLEENEKLRKENESLIEEIGTYEAKFSEIARKEIEEREKQKKIEKAKEAIKNKKWDEVYKLTERWYNHYPVEMSRSEVFTNLEKDGYITQEERTEAYNYFGSLWNYVGD